MPKTRNYKHCTVFFDRSKARWRVLYYTLDLSTGKRLRKRPVFESEAKAHKFAASKDLELDRAPDTQVLTPAQIAVARQIFLDCDLRGLHAGVVVSDALNAIDLLRSQNEEGGLAEIARKHLERRTGLHPGVTCAEVAQRYITARLAEPGVDARHIRGQKHNLLRFLSEFGDKAISDVTAQELTFWRNALLNDCSSAYIANQQNSIKMLFNWARDIGYLPRNHETEASFLKPVKQVFKPVELLTDNDLQKLFLACPTEGRGTLAILALAGLRYADAEKLTTEHLDFERSPAVLIMDADNKTRRAWSYEMRPALEAWLRHTNLHLGAARRVSPWPARARPGEGLSAQIRAVADEAGVSLRQKDGNRNRLRKTLITYFFAETGNENLVAGVTGTSPAMLRKYYRQDSSRLSKAAEAYFSVTPDILPGEGSNIIQFPGQAA